MANKVRNISISKDVFKETLKSKGYSISKISRELYKKGIITERSLRRNLSDGKMSYQVLHNVCKILDCPVKNLMMEDELPVTEDNQMSKINILVKKPGELWHKDTIDNTLKAFQKVVGGYIEVVTLERNTVIVCNEEGLLNWMPYNCTIGDRQFFGTIIMCKQDGEEFASIW